MKNVLIILIFIVAIVSCKQTTPIEGEKFEGEMFLKLIDVGPEIYSYPSKDGSTLKDLYENTPETELTDEQVEGKNHFELLNQNDLLEKPYFNFTEEKSGREFVKVFLNETEFAKIKDIKLSEIRDNGKKVEIKFYGKRINDHIIKCLSIEKVKKVKGKQQWKK